MNIGNLVLTPKTPIKGVYYVGQYGTSGYAQAAKGYLVNYFLKGISVTWKPLKFDDSKLNPNDLYDVIINSLISNNLPEYEYAIFHSTPDLWESFWKSINLNKFDKLKNKVVNGYCTWETSVLPKHWVTSINSTVNEVWCPSNYNHAVFKDSGVTIPIKVVPHIFLPKQLPDKKNIVLIDSISNERMDNDGKYTFYSIGELNTRKGISDLIHTYCKTFTNKDNVKLIIKTHFKNYSIENKDLCKSIIKDILNEYSNHASVICLLDNMTSDEILALHTLGDCYISLTKSEGFGLTIFDAFNYKKRIITTGYGGQLDFLGINHNGLVSYKMGKVEDMESFSSIYSGDWAIPNLEHAGTLMKSFSNI